MSPAEQIQHDAERVLKNIRSAIRHRHAQYRHERIAEVVDSPSFFWLAERAGRCPHETRREFRRELERAERLGLVHRDWRVQ